MAVGGQDGVHHEVGGVDPDPGQFGRRALGLGERGGLRPGHQHQPGGGGVGEGRQRAGVLVAVIPQPRAPVAIGGSFAHLGTEKRFPQRAKKRRGFEIAGIDAQ